MRTLRILLGLALLGAGLAHAQVAGRVLVAAGDVTVVRAGRTLPLTAGSTVESGDLVLERLADYAVTSRRPARP